MLSVAAALAMSSITNLPVSRPEEFRAAWVATVDNIDWPSRPGLPVAQMKREMTAILDELESLNMNAMVFQVRPSADSMYKSKLEPWSWFLTGEQGKAPPEDFDPLEWTVAESHKRGIEVHVWLNPYRAKHFKQLGNLHPSHIHRRIPGVVKQYGEYLWMDPSEPQVQDQSYAVFMDLVERYEIDGIHIDDYFYPYPITENGKKVDFPDGPAWEAYRRSGGKLSRDDWRRKSVDDFIDRVYSGIKARKPWVKFGISPFGIYRPGVPEGIRAGVDQYGELYADALKWLKRGWADYYTPQLYWPIEQKPQAFKVLLDWWKEQTPPTVHLWPGQYTSRTNPEGGDWKATQIIRQIQYARQQGANGTVHFSMKALQNNWNNVADELRESVYREPAMVPASPWLDPRAPRFVQVDQWSPASKTLRFTTSDHDAHFLMVYRLDGETWRPLQRLGAASGEAKITRWNGQDVLAVSAIDRVGNESLRVRLGD